MLAINPVLTPKGLLTAMVAVLLSGQALAETAGRVNFIVGEVAAINIADGSRRVLSKGDLVNSGERLETGKGRLQIRFTDGSFVSLQPNTVFGLDNYTFAKNKPEEGSLLFNFVRGGMRTVSGAIGKVNRANYKVKTPVATIGIRGTGYAATQEPNGRLMLTVSKGIVNLSNDFGNTNVPAGQTFQTEQGKAPEPAPKGEAVSARADSPDSADKGEDNNLRTLLATDDESFSPDFKASEQVQENGKPVYIQTIDGIPRLSSFGSLLLGSDGALAYPNLIALFDDLSSDGKTVGNLIGLRDTDGTLLFDSANSASPLHFFGVKQVRSLSFGEWTNGTAIVNDRLQTGGLSLSTTQFMPYIVGTTAEKALGQNMQVNYSLVDATPARAGNSVGQLTHLNISIDFSIEPLASVDLMVSGINGVNYSAAAQNRSLDVAFDKKLSGFLLNDFYATSSDRNGALCANNGCPVTLVAFLSGLTDMGVVYQIERPNTSSIGGVAVVGGTETTIVSDIAAIDRVESSLSNTFTALFETNTQLDISTATGLSAIFDSKTGGWRTGFHGQTTNEGNYGVAAALDESNQLINAATISDIHHKNKVLSWGSWTNGNVILDGVSNELPQNGYVHYMVGLTTAVLPSFGLATYNYVGGLSSDATITTNGTIGVNFGNLTSGINLALSFSQGNNTLLMAGSAAVNPNFTFNSLSTSLNGATAAACANCQASGFFAGPAAEMIGLKYKLSDANGNITGVGAFGKSAGGVNTF